MMRLCLLAAALLPAPLLAQPPANAEGRERGPWAADANGDGRITREEMTAWMTQRFVMMDPDGDGFVPVEAMQRMLGHDRPGASGMGASGDGQRPRPGGPGAGGRRGQGGMDQGGTGMGGMGDGMRAGRPGGPGGPEGRPRRDRAANGGDAGGPPPLPGRLMPRPEDANDDGMIDREEFLAPALAMFTDRDLNGDGVLTADELPPPPAPPAGGERPDE